MHESAIRAGEPFTAEETERLLSRFQREGYCDLGPVLEAEEVEALHGDMQRKWEDPAMHEPERDQIRGRSLMRMFEYSTAFRDLIHFPLPPHIPRHSPEFNNQVWHRGAPNTSDRTRLMGGVTYSKRFVSQKFYPFIDFRVPGHVWEGASPRLQRMLGRHAKGAYG